MQQDNAAGLAKAQAQRKAGLPGFGD